MSRKGERARKPAANSEQLPAKRTSVTSPPAPSAALTKHPWQLALSCALLAAWILFLAAMARG